MTGVKRMLALLMLLVMCSSCALSETEPALTVNGNAVSRGEADAWMYLVRSAPDAFDTKLLVENCTQEERDLIFHMIHEVLLFTRSRQ